MDRHLSVFIYRVIQEEIPVFWDVTVSVIVGGKIKFL